MKRSSGSASRRRPTTSCSRGSRWAVSCAISSIGPELLADLRLAVTEACGNAVRHAYGDGDGSVEVAFVVNEDRLEMIVADTGAGLALPVIERLLEAEPGRRSQSRWTVGWASPSSVRSSTSSRSRSGEDGRGTVVHMTKYLSDEPETPNAQPAPLRRTRNRQRLVESRDLEDPSRSARAAERRAFPRRALPWSERCGRALRARSSP